MLLLGVAREDVMATKILLALIAAGLLANAIVSFIGQARADRALANMAEDIHELWNGTCANSKLCK
jgi:hypothetical protein